MDVILELWAKKAVPPPERPLLVFYQWQRWNKDNEWEYSCTKVILHLGWFLPRVPSSSNPQTDEMPSPSFLVISAPWSQPAFAHKNEKAPLAWCLASGCLHECWTWDSSPMFHLPSHPQDHTTAVPQWQTCTVSLLNVDSFRGLELELLQLSKMSSSSSSSEYTSAEKRRGWA